MTTTKEPPARKKARKEFLVADLFCGAGGSSTGAKKALDRLGLTMKLVCLNHWDTAVASHKRNHPTARHYCVNIDEANPRAIVPEGYLDLLLASPECFPAGTLILTEKGFQPIESIKIGTKVLTHKGRWMPVTKTMSSKKDTIIIRGQGHYGLETTSEHPFYARQRKERHRPINGNYHKFCEPEWVSASELTQRKLFWATPTTADPLPIPEVKGRGVDFNPNFWWMVGRWLGDGTVRLRKTSSEITICCGFHEADDLEEKLNFAIPKNYRAQKGQYRWRRRNISTSTLFETAHTGLAEWLITHFGRHSHGKTIPAWVLTMKPEFKKALLNGYLSADGSDDLKKKDIISVSKRLAIGIRLLAETLGYRAALYHKKAKNSFIEGRLVKCKEAYRVKWTKKLQRHFGHEENIHSWLPTKETTEGRKKIHVYNLSVAEDESYVADGIVVHNCTHFSTARGGKPVSDQSRMACWQITRWATELDVKRIIIENVPEFQGYGPIDMRSGRPLKSKKGTYFHAFLDSLRAIGYTVDYRVLCAADYGDATTRERLFIMARKDGKPIVWPTPTHSKEGGTNLFGSTKKWRAAKEIIDWSDEGKSIFTRKKPLAQKTLKRIYAGAQKFGWPEPFLVILRNHMDAQSVDGPLPSITAGGTHIALANTILKEADPQSFMINPGTNTNKNSHEETSVNEPLPTDAKQPSYIVEATLKPFILNRHGENGSTRCHSTDGPTPTVTCRGAGYVLKPKAKEVCKNSKNLKAFLLSQQSGGSPRDTEEPVMTIAQAGAISVTKPLLFEVNHGDTENTVRAPLSIDNPVPALTTKRNLAIASPILVNMKGKSTASSTDNPPPAITTIQHLALAEPFLSAFYGDKKGKSRTPRSTRKPLGTQGTANRFGLVRGSAKAFIVPQFGERAGQQPRTHDIFMPMPAVTSHGAGALVEPLLVQTDQTGSNGCCVRSTKSPLPTILTRLNQAVVTPTLDEESISGIPVEMDGKVYLLDITFRMLNNPELAKAMGFSDEDAEYEFVGTKSDITKQIGNAVPINLAHALVYTISCDHIAEEMVSAA